MIGYWTNANLHCFPPLPLKQAKQKNKSGFAHRNCDSVSPNRCKVNMIACPMSLSAQVVQLGESRRQENANGDQVAVGA